MEEQKANNTTGTSSESKPKKRWRDVVDKISYKGIVSNVPFLLFVAMLCVLYIANTSRAVSLTRELNKKNKELKELKWEYLDVQSDLTKASSESRIISRSDTLGLQPLDKPAIEIRVKVPPTNK